MNRQPRPDNIKVAAITIMTTSRWVLTSRSHSNTQTDTENRNKVTESVAGSYLQRFTLEGGGWSGRRVCTVYVTLSSPGSSGSSDIYPLWVGNAIILDCWVISGIPQSYVRHTGLLSSILDPPDYVAILDDAIPWTGPIACHLG